MRLHHSNTEAWQSVAYWSFRAALELEVGSGLGLVRATVRVVFWSSRDGAYNWG